MERHLKRRNLPHLYYNEGIYFVTARLANTIPIDKLELMHQNILDKQNSNFSKYINHFIDYDSYLDKTSHGFDAFKNHSCAEILKNCLHYPDGKDYRLICYTIMSNHFHLVFELINREKPVSKIMQSIKGISANRINKSLNTSGQFWQSESYDRLVRDDIELYFTIKYVLLNPVNAKLVDDWRKWDFTYCNSDFDVI